MRLSKSLLTAFLLALALVAMPAFAADAPAAEIDFDALQGAETKVIGEDCNLNTCGKGTYCCNYSCSICAPYGASCTQQYCDPVVELDLEDPLAPEVEDPQEIRPATTPSVPAIPEPKDAFVFGGGQCGNNVCSEGQFCCNASCGICAPLGGACTDVYCPPES